MKITVFFSFLFLSFSMMADSYFASIESNLKENNIHHPAMFIDLDSLDHNIDAVMKALPKNVQLRVVTKSLPSLDLLKYVMNKAQTNKVMVFHHPFLTTLLKELPPNTEFLFGKPIPAPAVKEMLTRKKSVLLHSLPRVHWLIDSPEVLQAYIAVFKEMGQKFNVNLEIDVGMHRGGANESQFVALLDLARANKDILQLTGLMGYDGHVLHHPIPGKSPIYKEIARIKKNYQNFVEILNKYDDLKPQSGWVLNGAGSTTYSLYTEEDPLNDMAIGSAFLKSADFDHFTLEHHKPAVYMATPVLKKIKDAKIPFLGEFGATFNRVFRQGMTGYYLYGGSWSDQVVYPDFLAPSKLVNSTPNRNIISNQAYVIGKLPKDSTFDVGSFVFFRPVQNDTLFLFEHIHTLRNGKIVGKWNPFSRRL